MRALSSVAVEHLLLDPRAESELRSRRVPFGEKTETEKKMQSVVTSGLLSLKYDMEYFVGRDSSVGIATRYGLDS